MSRHLEALKRWVVPDPSLTLEQQLFQGLCLLAGIVAIFVIVPINNYPNLSPWVNRGIFAFGLVALALAWAARRGHYLKKTMLFAFLACLDFIWFPNGGSQGSIGLYFFMVVLYLMLFFQGTFRYAGVVLVVGDVIGLHLAEQAWPHLVIPFNSATDRFVDLASGYMISLPVCAMMIGVILWGFNRNTRLMKQTLQDLEGSEERFRLAMEATNDGIWDWNIATGEVYYNPSYTRMLGYEPEEFASRVDSWVELIFPEDRARVLAANEACIRGDEPGFEVEYRMKGRDGAMRWILGRGNAITRDDQGRALRMVGTHVEVTERKQAEEHLRESEGRYRTLFNNAQVGMFRTRLDGTEILEFNDKYLQIIGRTWEEVSHRPSTLVWAEPQTREEMVRRLVADGHVTDFEMRIQHSSGKVLDCITSIKLFREEGILEGSLIDLTERKQAEVALQNSEAMNRAILQGIPDLVFLDRRDGENLAVYGDPKQLIVPPESFLHRNVREFLPEPVALQFLAAFGEVLDAHAMRELTYELPIGGEAKQFEARMVPCTEDTVITIVRDVTQRKRDEEQQRQLQSQLQHALKMDSLGSLAGGVAHDMNNVLAGILGMAELGLDEQPVGSQGRRSFEAIVRAAERAGKMVKSLLNFARQSPAESRELDLNEILREEVGLLERTTLARIQLELELAADLRPIYGDASALTHAFMNLCVNALDAMPEKGTLALRTRNVDRDWIEVMVEDTGTGMAKEVLGKAMDPFFTTKEVGKGTGLGLSMVYSTVKAHQGQLEIQSEPGRGTRVMLRFPACDSLPQAPESPGNRRPESAAKALNVLLVDDDELIQSSALAILEALGHCATVVPCGEQALATLEAGFKPDVVILDMNMPGLGGAGTLLRLRAMTPTVPVVLATGRADEAAFKLTREHPRVTLLAKPYGMRELRDQLDLLGRV